MPLRADCPAVHKTEAEHQSIAEIILKSHEPKLEELQLQLSHQQCTARNYGTHEIQRISYSVQSEA